ncbi:hypothetical protein [Amycolatopsis sp. CA-230715]|uniref:hypothetical protein n=1 Tax=Amycolatopsis sp. CA-230715 TaxID=2745196 RepID=UPI001C032AA0|nr:hypothetical protein [Amycolatopsis sp. CA-230715]QWF81930.1 hypothetical protein HUW46_05365 [Amycolatopsis sp. CA-230715]
MSVERGATASEAERIVLVLENDLRANPEDSAVRVRLANALEALAWDVRSLTREQRPVITSAHQLRVCEHVANRILQLQVDDERLNAAARELLAEVSAGRGWTWAHQARALGLGLLVVVGGLLGVVFAGLGESVLFVVVAAVVSSGALAVVVLAHRRERWRVEAERVAPLVWVPKP